MLGGALPVTDMLEWKEEDQVIKTVDLAEPAASLELRPEVVQAMKKVREAMYSVGSSYYAGSRDGEKARAYR